MNRNKKLARVSDFLVGPNLLWLWPVGVLLFGGWYEFRFGMDVFQVASFFFLLLVAPIALTNSGR